MSCRKPYQSECAGMLALELVQRQTLVAQLASHADIR